MPPDAEDVAICFGMPAYGEHKILEEAASTIISETFAPMKICYVNDGVVAWAAATGMMPGVIVVAGTGSISYGKDKFGNWSRCGGWLEFFSDEGSGYWLGKRLLNIFSKQSDGRLPRTQLYEIVRKHFSIEDDFEICELVEHQISPYRKETAALQTLLLTSAREGDPFARKCYDEATDELAALVISNIRKLHFDDEDIINISYSGGLFSIDDLIRDSLFQKLAALLGTERINFHSPIMTPCEGAVMLAMENFCTEDFELFRSSGLKAN